jgi:hypothetical protein
LSYVHIYTAFENVQIQIVYFTIRNFTKYWRNFAEFRKLAFFTLGELASRYYVVCMPYTNINKIINCDFTSWKLIIRSIDCICTVEQNDLWLYMQLIVQCKLHLWCVAYMSVDFYADWLYRISTVYDISIYTVKINFSKIVSCWGMSGKILNKSMFLIYGLIHY